MGEGVDAPRRQPNRRSEAQLNILVDDDDEAAQLQDHTETDHPRLDVYAIRMRQINYQQTKRTAGQYNFIAPVLLAPARDLIHHSPAYMQGVLQKQWSQMANGPMKQSDGNQFRHAVVCP